MVLWTELTIGSSIDIIPASQEDPPDELKWLRSFAAVTLIS